MRQGRFAEAIECSRQAEAAANRVGDKASLAHALSTRNVCLLVMGRLDDTDLERVLGLYEELGDHVQVAVTLGNMAGKAFLACRWDDAADYVARSAESSRLAGDLGAAALAQVNLAELRVNQGRLEEAIPLLSSARRVGESFGYRVLMAAAAMQLGRAHAFAGELDDGLDLLRAAIVTFDEIGSPVDSLEARGRLAEVLVAGGLLAEAGDVLEDARRFRQGAEESPATLLVDRVALTLSAAAGDEAAFGSRLAPFVERARAADASYDLLVALRLAEALGASTAVEPAEAERLGHDLGVVVLPALSALSSR
jgi:tetratricopeptide (TPR) repeat protein